MALRPFWKGYMKLSLVTCPVAMTPATSEEDKVRFHVLNRRTGNRVLSQSVDAETGRPVGEDDEVKGYARGEHEYRPARGRGTGIDCARKRPHHRHRDFRRRREHRLDLVRHALLRDARRSGRRGSLLRHSRCDARNRDGRRIPARPQSPRTGGDPQSPRQRNRTLDAAGSATKCAIPANISPRSARQSPTRSSMRLIGDLIKRARKPGARRWSPIRCRRASRHHRGEEEGGEKGQGETERRARARRATSSTSWTRCAEASPPPRNRRGAA